MLGPSFHAGCTAGSCGISRYVPARPREGELAQKLLRVIFLCLTTAVTAAAAGSPAISIRGGGTLVVQGNAEVPPYGRAGGWTEGTSRSSARFIVRHFLFGAPNAAPLMELYVTRTLTGEPPDGVFEVGLVGGFLSSFASKAGYGYTAPSFDEMVIGGERVKRCRAELSKGDRKTWLYAYIFVRQPSLIFLTLRPDPNAGAGIEEYFRQVRFQ